MGKNTSTELVIFIFLFVQAPLQIQNTPAGSRKTDGVSVRTESNTEIATGV